MSGFCTQCGRPLADGEVCHCQDELTQQVTLEKEAPQMQADQQMGQVPPQMQQEQMGQVPPQMQQGQMCQVPPQMQAGQQTAMPQAPSAVKVFFTKWVELIKHPVTEGKEMMIRADIKEALLFILFQGLMNAVLMMAFMKNVFQNITTATGFVASFMKDALSEALPGVDLDSALKTVLEVPYVRILLVTVMLTFVVAAILALLLMGIHFIMKTTVSFQQMFSAVAIRSALLAPAVLIATLCFELSFGLGAFVLVFAGIWGFVAMVQSVATLLDAEHTNIFVHLISAVILIFAAVVLFIAGKAWDNYLPDALRTVIKQAKEMDWSELMKQFNY